MKFTGCLHTSQDLNKIPAEQRFQIHQRELYQRLQFHLRGRHFHLAKLREEFGDSLSPMALSSSACVEPHLFLAALNYLLLSPAHLLLFPKILSPGTFSSPEDTNPQGFACQAHFPRE